MKSSGVLPTKLEGNSINGEIFSVRQLCNTMSKWMSTAKIRMLKWMSSNTLKDRITHENIWDELEVAFINRKKNETCLRYFDHVQKRPIYVK